MLLQWNAAYDPSNQVSAYIVRWAVSPLVIDYTLTGTNVGKVTSITLPISGMPTTTGLLTIGVTTIDALGIETAYFETTIMVDPTGYTMQQFIMDIMPRVGKIETRSGITIYSAANSILSLIYKKLLSRHSDLLASGELYLSIPVYGYLATLPSDFVAPAERPRSEENITDWLAGTVTSYDDTTGLLVLNVTGFKGSSDSVSAWNIYTAGVADTDPVLVGTSVTGIIPASGSQSFTTQTNLGLSAGQKMMVISSRGDTTITRKRYLDPNYLTEDREHDDVWYDWYGTHSDAYDPPSSLQRKFKIVGQTMYVRPKIAVQSLIRGKYFQKPPNFSALTDTFPWYGLFDEVFREGVIRIMQKGVPIPEADPDFMIFLTREIDPIINSRISLLPNRRMQHHNWM